MADDEGSPSICEHYQAALVLYSMKYVEHGSESFQQLKAKTLRKLKCPESQTKLSERGPMTPEQDSPQPAAAPSNPLRMQIPDKISDQDDNPTGELRMQGWATPETESPSPEAKKPALPTEEEIQDMIRNYQPPATPPFEALRGLIGECSQPFEKQLTNSDLRIGQSRLTISKFDALLLHPLLREGEELEAGIPVTVYDGEGKEYPMTFKVWQKIHVLTFGWPQFFMDHQLLSHQDFVTLWMFRNLQTDGLCFAISWRRLPVFTPVNLNRRRIH